MIHMEIKAAENIPCDTEIAQRDKLSDEALVNMEKKLSNREKHRIIVEALGECSHDPILDVESAKDFFWIWSRLKSRGLLKAFLLYVWDDEIPIGAEDFDVVIMAGAGCRRIVEVITQPIRLRDVLVEFLEGRK